MKERILSWWAMRSVREQQMLVAMLVLVTITIFWFGIARPLRASLADAKARHERVVGALADARGQAALIRSLERTAPAPRPGSLGTFVSHAASEAGFTVARLEPQGDNQVDLMLEAARPQAFFAWVSALERRDGLVVERLTARANSDTTLSIQLVIRGRRR